MKYPTGGPLGVGITSMVSVSICVGCQIIYVITYLASTSMPKGRIDIANNLVEALVTITIPLGNLTG